MHPATVHLCHDALTGAEVVRDEGGSGCVRNAYSARRLDLGVARLIQRSGYFATIGYSSSNLYFGFGGWLGPDGGGLDLLKAGVSLGSAWRNSWAAPLNLGFTTLMFDQVRGGRNWGVFAPFMEFAVLFGRRNIMVGPYATLQYRWLFGAPDEAQVSLGFYVSIVLDEHFWRVPAIPGEVGRR